MATWSKWIPAALAALSVQSYADAGVHAFPSAGSWVVGSPGRLDKDRVGLFWSRERGDSVTQTFDDPLPYVDRVILRLRPGDTPVFDDPYNAGVLWAVKINDLRIGTFSVMPGWTGETPMEFRFDPIASPGDYTVRLEVIGTTPGSYPGHTFGADIDTSVSLIPAPGAAALLGVGGLLAARRRRV
ncbi:MAG: hypothetical protein IT436_08310 [Phycisphaerales bacterium]|nr:hypothetical protein [Phycisphaerales bacterium]